MMSEDVCPREYLIVRVSVQMQGISLKRGEKNVRACCEATRLPVSSCRCVPGQCIGWLCR